MNCSEPSPRSAGFSRPGPPASAGISPLHLFQLADSAFPSGGFVHSGGLESAWQLGLVDADHLQEWLIDACDQLAHGLLPLVGEAHADTTPLAELDRLTDAWLTSHVANRASRAQGQAWMGAVAAAFPDTAIDELKLRLRHGDLLGHAAPCLGATLRLLGCDRATTRRLVLFLHLRSLVSAAIRLGIIGPLAAQRLQAELTTTVEDLLAATDHLGYEDLATVQPLHDLAQQHHDRLYSRLFAT
jgi:urease accessory protein